MLSIILFFLGAANVIGGVNNSKVQSSNTTSSNNPSNVAFEVHDWWSDQVIHQQSSGDEDED